jgi:hypothetical protein
MSGMPNNERDRKRRDAEEKKNRGLIDECILMLGAEMGKSKPSDKIRKKVDPRLIDIITELNERE